MRVKSKVDGDGILFRLVKGDIYDMPAAVARSEIEFGRVVEVADNPEKAVRKPREKAAKRQAE